MADLADVLDALQSLAVSTLMPDGTLIPGLIGNSAPVVNIGQGWPPANAVDDAMKAGNSLASIYAVPSSTSKLLVPLASSSDNTLIAPVHGMAVTLTDTGFTLTGEPNAGEYATAVLGGKAYSVVAAQGDLVESVVARLATAIAADWPGTTATGATVTLATAAAYTVRIGAAGTLGQIIDRQRQNVMVSVWAPNSSDRAVLGRALDVAIKRNLTITLPDTTQAILIAQTTSLIDKYETELAYRRDMTVQCQWDTLDTFPGYEVTSVQVQLPSPTGRTFDY